MVVNDASKCVETFCYTIVLIVFAVNINRKKLTGVDLMKTYMTQTGRSFLSDIQIQSAIDSLPQNSMATISDTLPENISKEVADLIRKKNR